MKKSNFTYKDSHQSPHISQSRAQLTALIKKITKDMPHGVTVQETKTGVSVHFTIFEEGPKEISNTSAPPDIIIL